MMLSPNAQLWVTMTAQREAERRAFRSAN